MYVRSIASACLILGLGTANALGAGGPQSGKSVKIGVIADVTGSAAAYGTSQKNAYDLAADDLKAGRIDAGGATLTFDVQDAASDAAQVVNLTQKFTGDGSALLIGPTLSGEAKKADPIAVKAGLTILATSNTAQGITSMGPCVFRDALAEEQVVPEAVDRAVAKWRPKTAAIVYGDDNQFTKTDYEIFKAALEKHHVTILDAETYHTGDVDFKAQLTNVAAKKPDILVVGSLLEEAVKIVVQARQAGIKSHLIGGNGLNSPKFVQLAGDAGDGVVIGAAYFVGNSYAGNKAFNDRYKAKFATGADQFAAQAYAAAQLAAAAVKSGATTPDGFCNAFKKLRVVQTVLGPVNFLPSRDVRAASAIVQVTKGGFAYFS
ncbi:MAG: ABC transporter substrate-binding protein [Candidatus Eremiobacteraeota bacterium]|nr:ABC transporter substrate-binding protein [Candidatus Eremiobacteraeota bacterium]